MLTFTIADTDIVWRQADYTPRVGEFSRLFLSDSPRSEHQIAMTGRFCDLDSITALPKLAEEEIYDIHAQGTQRYYLYHWAYLRDAYAVPYHALSLAGENAYLFNPTITTQLPLSFDWILGVTGLHKLFLQLGKAVFHASYIDIGGEALLFAAPSETGKSTQADLWAKHAGAEVINGDRVAIGLKDGRYHAYGYPACGSSGICINRTLPIRAIIVLEQGSENRVLPMTPGEKFRACLSGMVINAWEAEETAMAMNLAEKWLENIPIYRFSCRKDADAVATLRRFLEENP